MITTELYPIGQLPNKALVKIGKAIAYKIVVGQSDISGDDWGDIFADAFGAKHLASPLGLVDVLVNNMAWSTKTVKIPNPHTATNIRVISGRCSPDFSYDITDPRADIQKTGDAVLSIYNERINISRAKYEQLRSVFLIRNVPKCEFLIFEHDLCKYNTGDYEWRENSKRNFEGFNKITNKHCFTWQPHGAQLTIKHWIPASAQRFKIKKPEALDYEKTMELIGFNDSWVTILN